MQLFLEAEISVRVFILILTGVLCLLCYALQLFCKEKIANKMIFFSVPLHFLLILSLLSVGADMEILLCVFLGLITLYTGVFTLLRFLECRRRCATPSEDTAGEEDVR